LALNDSKHKITKKCWVRESITVYIKTPEKVPLSQAVSCIGKQSMLAVILICSESGSKYLSLMYTYAVN